MNVGGRSSPYIAKDYNNSQVHNQCLAMVPLKGLMPESILSTGQFLHLGAWLTRLELRILCSQYINVEFSRCCVNSKVFQLDI